MGEKTGQQLKKFCLCHILPAEGGGRQTLRTCRIASRFLKQFRSAVNCDYPRLHISVCSGGVLKHFGYSLMEHFPSLG